MDEIMQVLNWYNYIFGHIPEWKNGTPAQKVAWLCSRASEELNEFKLQAEPRKDEYIAAINRWYGRRITTKWSQKEQKALKAVLEMHTTDEDFALLDRYYSATIPQGSDYRRRDVVTLLNNWAGEIDRARKFGAVNQIRNHVHVRV